MEEKKDSYTCLLDGLMSIIIIYTYRHSNTFVILVDDQYHHLMCPTKEYINKPV